jgi:hypothetical protein
LLSVSAHSTEAAASLILIGNPDISSRHYVWDADVWKRRFQRVILAGWTTQSTNRRSRETTMHNNKKNFGIVLLAAFLCAFPIATGSSAKNWNTTNGNWTIGAAQYGTCRSHFGQPPESGSGGSLAMAVPEAASGALCSMTVVVAFATRRSRR